MSDILKFYSKSADVLPGKGNGEVVANISDYSELSNYTNWRRILSNFYPSVIIYNNLTYPSIEHAYQAAKISLVDNHKSYQFSVNSNSVLSKSNAATAQQRGQKKYCRLDPIQIIEWNNKSSEIMQELLIYRFDNDDIFHRVVMATKNAELWHIRQRKAPERWHFLEYLRNEAAS